MKNNYLLKASFIWFVIWLFFPLLKISSEKFDGDLLSVLLFYLVTFTLYTFIFGEELEKSLNDLSLVTKLSLSEKIYFQLSKVVVKYLKLLLSILGYTQVLFSSILGIVILVVIIGGIFGILKFGWSQLLH
jgi:hypothetical protein